MFNNLKSIKVSHVYLSHNSKFFKMVRYYLWFVQIFVQILLQLVINYHFLFNYFRLEMYHQYKEINLSSFREEWTMTGVRRMLSWKPNVQPGNGFNQGALANNNSLSEKLTFAGAPIRREEKYRRHGYKTRRGIPRVRRKSAGINPAVTSTRCWYPVEDAG